MTANDWSFETNRQIGRLIARRGGERVRYPRRLARFVGSARSGSSGHGCFG